MGLINIQKRVKDVVSKVFGKSYSGTESVTTTASALSSQSVPKGGSVLLKADATNGDYIKVGGTNESSHDFVMRSGDTTNIAVSDVSNLTAQSNSGTQTLYWITEGE